MSEEAIENIDVSEAEAQQAQEEAPEESGRPEMSERERRLQEISREHAKLNAPEEEEFTEDEDSPEQEQAAPDPLAELGYYRNQSGDLVTTMKVNGREVEVRADQVKAYLQKDIAGDYKLQAAAEREKRLQERESLIQSRESQLKQSLSQPPKALGAEEARKQAQAFLEKVWDGDSDEAAAALADMLQRNTATVDENSIREAAERAATSAFEQREAARQAQDWQTSVDDGNRQLSDAHPEIYQDEYLFDLVNGKTAKMVAAAEAGDPEYMGLTPAEMIRKAAEDVQAWRSGKTQDEPPATNSRAANKANLKPVPSGMARTPQKPKTQEVDTSPAAVIERMRAGRATSA